MEAMRAILVSLLVVPLLVPVVPADAPPAFTKTDLRIPSSVDGLPLAATVYAPTSGCPCPAILMTHGWGGNRVGLDGVASGHAAEGYVVLAYDSRGWADSAAPIARHAGGVVTLDGPNEVADARTLLDFLAGLATDASGSPIAASVLLDGPGDPRVGMRGESYAGGIQLLVAEVDDRVDTIVPEITWHDLRTSLFPAGVVKEGYVALLFASGQAYPYGRGVMHPDLSRWYADAHNPASDHAEVLEALRIRSAAADPAKLDLPVLVVSGLDDPLFTPDEARANYLAVQAAGGEPRLLLTPGGHGYGSTRPYSASDVSKWYACYLKDDCSAGIRGDGTVSIVSTDGKRRNYTGLPASGTGPANTFPGAKVAVSSVAPSSHTAFHQFEPSSPIPSTDARTSSVTISGTVWAPPGGARVVGVPRLTFTYDSPTGGVGYAKLASMKNDGSYTVVHDQVQPFRFAAAATPTTMSVDLVQTDFDVPAGLRLVVIVALTDDMYETQDPSVLSVYGGSVSFHG